MLLRTPSVPFFCFLLAAALISLPCVSEGSKGSEEQIGFEVPFVNLNTGASTVTVPIDVPKGTGGFQPNLELRYSSQAGEGIFGVGWHIALGEIRIADRFGTPKLDGTDRYELDGALLVPNPAAPTEYRTATETFSKIVATLEGDAPLSWEATFPNGTLARYGSSQFTRIRQGGDTYPVDDTGPIVRWLLTELEDVNGNVVKFDYDRSVDIGSAYPLRTRHTYHGGYELGGGARGVQFVYEPRPDPIISFRGGALMEISQRVSEIRSHVELPWSADLAYRRRTFEYDDTGYTTGRSRLTSTVLYGSDCDGSNPATDCVGMPARSFEYRDPSDTIPDTSSTSAQWVEGSWGVPRDFMVGTGDKSRVGTDNGVRFGDVNGDGLIDLVRAWWNSKYPGSPPGEPEHHVYLNTGAGWTKDEAWSDALAAVAFLGLGTFVEVCDEFSPQTPVLFAIREPFISKILGASRLYYPQDAQLIDLNADGLADLLVSYQVGPRRCGDIRTEKFSHVWLNTGSRWERDTALSDSLAADGPIFRSSGGKFSDSGCSDFPPRTSQFANGAEGGALCVPLHSYPRGTTFADLNGDGRPDLVSYTDVAFVTYDDDMTQELIEDTEAMNSAWINTENGWVRADHYLPPYPLLALASGLATDTGVRLVDVNGDGLADVVKGKVTVTDDADGSLLISDADPAIFEAEGVWLNTGYGWCDATAVGSDCPAGARYLPPVAFGRAVDSGKDEPPISAERYYLASNVVQFTDLNGDGWLDLVRTEGDGWDCDVPGGLTDGMNAWIHDPAGDGSVENPLWKHDERFVPPEELSTLNWVYHDSFYRQYDRGARIVDADSNGTLDFVKKNDGLNDPVVRMSQTTLPDKLASYDTGQGGRYSFSYDTTGYALDSYTEPSGFDGMPLPLPPPFVTSVSVEGIDKSYDIDVSYDFPRRSPEYRAFLGFRESTAETDGDYDGGAGVGSKGASLLTTFYQTYGLVGSVAARTLEGSRDRVEQIYTREVVDGSSVTGSLPGADVGRLTDAVTRIVREPPSSAAGATRSVHYDYDDRYGYNFASGVTVTRPTGTIAVTRVPEPADTTNWIIGRLASETHEDGNGVVYRQQDFVYTDPQEQDSRGLLWESRRSVGPRTTDPTFAEVAVTKWFYDTYGNVIETHDPEGRIRKFCYDGDTGGSCPSGTTGTHTVLTAVIDPLEGVTEISADLATGDIEYLKRFNGDEAWLEPDAFGRPTELWVQPESHGTATLLEERTYVDSPDAIGRPYFVRSEQIGNGSEATTAVYYDGLGHVARQVYDLPASSGGSGYAGKYFLRDYAGRTIRESYGVACSDEHCSNLASIQNSEVLTAYDGLGRMLTRTTPDGATLFDYEPETAALPAGPVVGNVSLDAVIVAQPNGGGTKYLMDGDRVVFTRECDSVTGGLYYLSCNNPDTTFYTYEPTGEVATLYDAQAVASADYVNARHHLTYEYDTLGRITSVIDPDGGTTQTTYDLVGNVKTVTNARGQIIEYFYDKLDRPIRIDLPESGPSFDPQIAYDPHTRRRAWEGHPAGPETMYTYDDFGRVAREVHGRAGLAMVMDFEYDLLGRPTKILYPSPGAEVTYRYEGAYLKEVCGLGVIDSCQTGDYFVSDVEYDGIGRVEHVHETPGTRSFAYDSNTHRMSQIEYLTGSDHAVKLDYVYDAMGNATDVADTHTNVGTDGLDASAIYTYDTRNRLDSVSLLGSTKYFGYDNLGNLTHRDALGAAIPENKNQHYDHPDKPHAITQAHTAKTYEYDADGNVIRRGNQNFSFDSQNRLVCAGTAADPCTEHSYAYSIDGDLTRHLDVVNPGWELYVRDYFEWDTRTGTATAHVFAFGREIAVLVSQNATLREAWVPKSLPLPIDPRPLVLGVTLLAMAAFLLLLAKLGAYPLILSRPLTAAMVVLVALTFLPPNAWAGGPAIMGDGGNDWARRWISHDHLGSAILYTDESGTTVKRRVFEPFGQLAAESDDTEATRRLFTGQRYEESAGLYDFRARWYDAEAGRFLSVDPVIQIVADPQGHNAYTYVRNNPVHYTDPEGLEGGFLGIFLIVFILSTAVRTRLNTYNGSTEAAATYRTAAPVAPVQLTPEWAQEGAPTVAQTGPGAGAQPGQPGENPQPDSPGSQSGYSAQATCSDCAEPSYGPVEIITTIYGGVKIVYGGLRHGLPALARWLGKRGAGISDDAARIARGHAWGKHGHEFPEFENADEFAEHIDSVIRKPSAERSLSRGRHAYYDESTNTVVIKDPKNPEGGTAFRPRRGREYFEGLE